MLPPSNADAGTLVGMGMPACLAEKMALLVARSSSGASSTCQSSSPVLDSERTLRRDDSECTVEFLNSRPSPSSKSASSQFSMPETIELIEAIRAAKLRFGAAMAEWVDRARRGRLRCSETGLVEEVGRLVFLRHSVVAVNDFRVIRHLPTRAILSVQQHLVRAAANAPPRHHAPRTAVCNPHALPVGALRASARDMMDRRIVPVEPASGRGELVVIEVQQDGAHELDVRLVGCEGENPYVANIKQSQLPQLKRKFKGSDADWEAVLAHFLLQKQPDPDQAKLLEGVRIVYALKKHHLEVTWGEIVLPRDDEFEFNPFEWAQTSAQAHSRTLQELVEVKAHISSEKDTITKLNAQLDDFIKTKNEAETAMLQQFMELLNEKKRKIRDQSRLLAGAKVDKSTAIAIQSARTETPRKAGPSRPSKRKAPTRSAKAALEQDSDSDQMEIEETKIEEQNDGEDAPSPATPDRVSEAETESDEEASDSGLRGGSSQTLKSTSTIEQPAKKAASSEGPPPPRSLPFGRAGTRSKGPAKTSPAPPPAEDDDDETDDEEL
ncbi:hypothetical protein OPT61_g10256 [Boeremia exigua]|uniref:Uncharacterized protein n=1 Tax=Boeremia exigua TaxID=749465 RepID=A0ACC2HQQ8_9PLEO|nr:hypothetical protein OPT61_g10256 [Boeremia exigua]